MRPVVLLSVMALVAVAPGQMVVAQGYGGPMGGGGMMSGGPGPGMMGRQGYLPDPAGLPALKEKLAITPEQEPQWKGYADAVSNAWETRQGMRQSMPQTMPATPEERQQRMEMRQNHREAGAQLHADVQKARDDLAVVLSPDQRKTLDQSVPAVAPMGPPR